MDLQDHTLNFWVHYVNSIYFYMKAELPILILLLSPLLPVLEN